MIVDEGLQHDLQQERARLTESLGRSYSSVREESLAQ